MTQTPANPPSLQYGPSLSLEAARHVMQAAERAALQLLTFAGMCAVEGGVPLLVGGRVVGAIGVSGVRSGEDAQIAAAGARALEGV